MRKPLSLQSVTIRPQEVKSIDLAAAIVSTPAPQLIGTYGSLVLRYRSPYAATLYAATMVRRSGHAIAFHVDAMGESEDLQAGSREGIWWLPKETTSDYLILTNQGKTALPLDLSLFDASGKQARQKVFLGPAETIRYSIRNLIMASGLAGSYGGIKISTSAHAGSLESLHFLFDETAGFSAILKMFDYNPSAKLEERDYAHTAAWTLRAPMLALSNPDPALAFPPGTKLLPQLFIRNTMPNPIGVVLRFNWRAANSTGKAPGPALALAPYETRRIDVAALQDSAILPKEANWTSVTITTNSKPDELMAIAASYDSTLSYGAQTPFSDQLTFKWEGGMWEYDPYHNSIITAGNGGVKPTQAAFTVFYNQGTRRYDLEQTLQPDEQMWIDIGRLIREQIPDKNGKKLPSDLAMGSYQFRDLTNTGVGTLFEGKVIYDKTYGHVAYGCAACCGYATPFPWHNPIGVPFGGPANQGVDAPDQCLGGATADVSDSFWYHWTTANTSIATVDSCGTHTGVSVNSTTSQTNGQLNNNDVLRLCPAKTFYPGGSVNVVQISQTPISLNLSSGDTGKGITVAASPSTVASSVVFSQGSTSNPNSSNIATFTFNKPGSFTGNDLWKISVAGTNSPSGIQNAIACAYGVCASQASTTNTPPQVLIQVLYGEAHGQAVAGDSVSEPAIGSSIKDRFGRSEFPGGSQSTYQAVIISSQYNGINTSITTGVEPELDVAVALFSGTQPDTVASSPCFFSPTATGWAQIQAALNSGTTIVPNVSFDPHCYGSNRQLVYKSSIGNNANGNGARAFIFERQKANSTNPAVVQIQ